MRLRLPGDLLDLSEAASQARGSLCRPAWRSHRASWLWTPAPRRPRNPRPRRRRSGRPTPTPIKCRHDRGRRQKERGRSNNHGGHRKKDNRTFRGYRTKDRPAYHHASSQVLFWDACLDTRPRHEEASDSRLVAISATVAASTHADGAPDVLIDETDDRHVKYGYLRLPSY